MDAVTAKWTRLIPFVSVAAVATLFAACGAERDASRPMTEGEQIALDSGCTACHGTNGEGGVGPAWKGLAGSDVELSDGSTVTADDAYLTESIRDPSAKSVKGYGAMPQNSLSDDEIAAVVEFIKSLEK